MCSLTGVIPLPHSWHVSFGSVTEAWDVVVVVDGGSEAGEADTEAEVAEVDGTGCADVNGTDGASLRAGMASRLSGYNPLA